LMLANFITINSEKAANFASPVHTGDNSELGRCH
jgi:hypothetical protein